MPVEADLVAYLAGATALTAGTDLFEGPMPGDPPDCVSIVHYGGEDAERVMGSSLAAPGYEVALVQLMVRRETRATAIADANAYHALLDKLGPVTLSTRLYHLVESLGGEPAFLREDKNDNWLYTADYRVTKARG